MALLWLCAVQGVITQLLGCYTRSSRSSCLALKSGSGAATANLKWVNRSPSRDYHIKSGLVANISFSIQFLLTGLWSCHQSRPFIHAELAWSRWSSFCVAAPLLLSGRPFIVFSFPFQSKQRGRQVNELISSLLTRAVSWGHLETVSFCSDSEIGSGSEAMQSVSPPRQRHISGVSLNPGRWLPPKAA